MVMPTRTPRPERFPVHRGKATPGWGPKKILGLLVAREKPHRLVFSGNGFTWEGRGSLARPTIEPLSFWVEDGRGRTHLCSVQPRFPTEEEARQGRKEVIGGQTFFVYPCNLAVSTMMGKRERRIGLVRFEVATPMPIQEG